MERKTDFFAVNLSFTRKNTTMVKDIIWIWEVQIYSGCRFRISRS